MKLTTLNDRDVRDINSRELGERTESECDAAALDQDRVAELSALSALEYDRQRVETAEGMGVRVSVLDDVVKRRRQSMVSQNDDDEEVSIFPIRKPWPDRVDDMSAVLSCASDLVLRYMAMEKHWGDVTAMWCLHTYMVSCFNVSPRYAAQSPTPECGKSTLLSLIHGLVRKPLKTANIQPAGVFRVVELYDPTLIIDEGDSFLHENEQLRGILNSGHAKGDHVIRVEGEPLRPKTYRVFGACAFGSIKELPGTLQSRCIPNRLRRATTQEAKAKLKFRQDRPPAEMEMIAAQFQRWAMDNASRLAGAEPDMGGLYNRQADNWRPLYAIADLVGGEWPRRIREAARKIVGIADAVPLNVELLIDIHRIVKPPAPAPELDFIGSNELIGALVAMDGGSRPWADWKARGKPMTMMALSEMLKEFGIQPGHDRSGKKRGYAVATMRDAFSRYLPPQGVKPSETQQNQAQVEFSSRQADFAPDTLESARSADEIRFSDTLTPSPPQNGAIGGSDDDDDPAEWSEARLESEMPLPPDDDLEIPGFLDRRRP